MFLKPSSLVLKSYAKINVSLKIVGKKENGFHELEMVFLPLDLHDIIEIDKFPGSPDTFITCDDIGLTNHRQNLCMKAVDAMRRQYGFKEQFNIRIHKEIPFAAGLGGGSSNAATVMMGLVKMLRLDAKPEDLRRIALGIGADVPYFFSCKPALVTGVGDIVKEVPMKRSYPCLIVKPKEGLHTQDVYEAYDHLGVKENADTENVLKALQYDDLTLLSKSVGNDLYPAAVYLLPAVKEVVNFLRLSGLPVAMMTGSGSACFAFSDNIAKLKEAGKRLAAKGNRVELTKTLL